MAIPTLNDTTLAQLMQTREYHAKQLQRIDDALALLRDVGKTANRAAALTERVQARHGSREQKTPKGMSAMGFARAHARFNNDSPSDEIRRLVKAARAEGLTFSFGAMSAGYYLARKEHLTGRKGKAAYVTPAKAKRHNGMTIGQLAYQRKKTGDSAINRIRALFLSDGVTGPLTREQIQEQAKVADVMTSPRAVPAGTARILQKMTEDRELKATKDGWVALRVQRPPVNAHNSTQPQLL